MTEVSSESRPRSFFRWPIRILAIVILLLLVLRFYGASSVGTQSDLRRLNIVPPFTFTERSGRTITNKELYGKIWVADFVYTTCPGPCPLITAAMARLQSRILPDTQVQLVTFTVDPQNDTPAVLETYANRYSADKNRWWFLTGPEKQIYSVIRDGFFQAVEDNRGKPLEAGQFTVTHSTQMALVDSTGVVRGFYEGLDAQGQEDLLRDIKIVEQEK